MKVTPYNLNIEYIIDSITRKITTLNKVPYDEAFYQFTSSITYQLIPKLISNTNEDSYSKIINTIYQTYLNELTITTYLEEPIVALPKEEITAIKTYAITNQVSIEEAYQHLNIKKHQRLKKRN